MDTQFMRKGPDSRFAYSARPMSEKGFYYYIVELDRETDTTTNIAWSLPKLDAARLRNQLIRGSE